MQSVIICGDSTAANFPPEDLKRGWGQLLGDFLPEAEVRNHAMAGRSTRTFLLEGRLEAALADVRAGDLVLIQFGHNDENRAKPERYADPDRAYPENLEIFVRGALEKSGQPVLLTPICMREWRDGVLQNTHGVYPDRVRETAARLGVPLIDLYAESFRIVEALGESESRKLFMNLDPGEDPRLPEGSADNAHTRQAGAAAFAEKVAEGLRKLGLTAS